jgi:protein arginine phosphatase
MDENVKNESPTFAELVNHALDLLKAGHTIVAPTETAYGLLANAEDEKAVRNLFELKKRSLDKTTAIFIKSHNELSKYTEINDPKIISGIKRLWPGPVTFVLKAKNKNWPGIVSSDGLIGFRCSSHPFIIELMKKAPFPITATSANITGQTINSFDDLKSVFSKEIKLFILDESLNFNTMPSTVVAIGDKIDRTVILRKGTVETEIIRKKLTMSDQTDKIFRILFVCTGNTCRSPMAEGMLRKLAKEDGLEYMDVISAGTGTLDGYPATNFGVAVAARDGVNITNHHSSQLLSGLMDASDVIFALALNHYQHMISLYPEDQDKTYMLKSFPEDIANPDLSIADPIGLDVEEYQKTYNEIKTELVRIWPHIKERYMKKMESGK